MRSRAPETSFPAALLLLLAALGAARAMAEPLLEQRLPDGSFLASAPMLAEDVFDPIFGFFVAVLDHDQFGEVNAAFLDSLARAEAGSKVPYEHISTMSRSTATGADAFIRIDLQGAFTAPIPFSILGYKPGSLRATPRMDMVHWDLGDQDFVIDPEKKDGASHTVTVHDSHLFVMAEGAMEMDIDGWLDRLLGSRLDDVVLTGFYVFRHEGKRIGLGFGYNPKREGRTGAFDFTANESIFPASRDFLVIGRQVRAMGERRLAAWRTMQDPGADPRTPHTPD